MGRFRTYCAAGALLLSAFVPAVAQAAPADQPIAVMQGFPPAPDAIVNIDTWWSPPYNVWAFRNLDQVIPNRSVYRGEGPVSPLPRADAAKQRHFLERLEKNGFDLSGFLRDGHVDAMLVMKSGEVIAEQYRNGQTPSSRHIMMSVGKSFLGTLAEALVQDGTIDESRAVASYVPELVASAYGDATVRQVMDMLVSVNYSEAYADPMSDVSQFLYAARFAAPPKGVSAKAGIYAFLPTLRKLGQHGQAFQYVTPTSEVLGWVIARASGKSWADLLEKKIYQSLGAERDGFVLVDGVGTQTAAGGLALTLRDVGRFAQMMANGGELNGQRALPQAVVDRIRAGGDPARWVPYPWDTGVNSYTSQWYVDHGAQKIRALGIHGQYIEIDFDDDYVVVLQSSWPIASSPEYWSRHYAFGKAVGEALK